MYIYIMYIINIICIIIVKGRTDLANVTSMSMTCPRTIRLWSGKVFF